MSDKLNIDSLVTSSIESAKVSSMIEIMRANGASEVDIVKAVLGDSVEEHARLETEMLVILKFKQFDSLIGFGDKTDPNDIRPHSKTFLGFTCLLQHYTYRPEAIAFVKILQEAQTLRDLWEYFLAVNQIDLKDVYAREDYDHGFFQALLNKPYSLVEEISFSANSEGV